MVGKPNIENRERLNEELDEEREASMADEGGAAGAQIELQPGPRASGVPPYNESFVSVYAETEQAPVVIEEFQSEGLSPRKLFWGVLLAGAGAAALWFARKRHFTEDQADHRSAA